MENWEVQEMKDSLVMMRYLAGDIEDKKMLGKALEYMNELEEKLIEIANQRR